jgi:hypothetical protein
MEFTFPGEGEQNQPYPKYAGSICPGDMREDLTLYSLALIYDIKYG